MQYWRADKDPRDILKPGDKYRLADMITKPVPENFNLVFHDAEYFGTGKSPDNKYENLPAGSVVTVLKMAGPPYNTAVDPMMQNDPTYYKWEVESNGRKYIMFGFKLLSPAYKKVGK